MVWNQSRTLPLCRLAVQAQNLSERLLDRRRGNSEFTKSGHFRRWHIIDPHLFHLIPSDKRTWHHLRNPSQCLPSGKWNRNEDRLQPCLACKNYEKLLISIDEGAAALECNCVRL